MEETRDPAALVDEAVRHNDSLEAFLGEKMELLHGVGRLQRSLADTFVRRGLGVSMNEGIGRIRAAGVLLRDVQRGGTALERARPELRSYAQFVERLAKWVEGLEPMARSKVKDARRREEILEQGAERIAEAERLAEILWRL